MDLRSLVGSLCYIRSKFDFDPRFMFRCSDRIFDDFIGFRRSL